MTKEEHFSLVLKSLEVDPTSWKYDNSTYVRYRLENEKLNCNIWIPNGLLYFDVYRGTYSNSKLYDLNIWQQIKLYFIYCKWKKNYKK